MRSILVTGFEPFGGEHINPAWETAFALPQEIGGFRIWPMQVPTVFGDAGNRVIEARDDCDAAAIIMLGQAGGRNAVTPEQVAINLRRASIPDNAGYMPPDEPVMPGGPDGIFTELPVNRITQEMAAEGYRIRMSYSAGTFVCNDLFYTVARVIQKGGTPCAFVHVPFLPEQAGEGVPSMTQEELNRTVLRFLEKVAETLTD